MEQARQKEREKMMDELQQVKRALDSEKASYSTQMEELELELVSERVCALVCSTWCQVPLRVEWFTTSRTVLLCGMQRRRAEMNEEKDQTQREAESKVHQLEEKNKVCVWGGVL